MTKPLKRQRTSAKRVRISSSGREILPEPLTSLVPKVKKSPGAAFAPEAIESLRTLKAVDRPAFEALRHELKEAGCRVSELDKEIGSDRNDDGRAPTQSNVLLELASSAEPFHSADGTAYADANVEGHRETWPVMSTGFKRWLSTMYLEETGGAPSSEAVQSVINTLEAVALTRGPKRPVFIRVGAYGDAIYLDLCDPTWRAVEIDSEGWRIVETPPIRFRRSTAMQALPLPQTGGSIEQLRQFLHLEEESEFVLVVSWLLATIRDKGPYPVLVLTGEQGSSKSTFLTMLRSLIDPNVAPHRTLPREERELYISTRHQHLLAFDNVSHVSSWLSDALCRISTGGAMSLRKLYTDQEEVLFNACKPMILNGIEDLIKRPDLADRAILLTLAALPEEKRRPAEDLWRDFEECRPEILGVLLDAISEGLRRLPEISLPGFPRMADFAKWASACETAIWPAGTFWEAYEDNLATTVINVLEDDPVTEGIQTLMATRSVWSGTASELLTILIRGAAKQDTMSKSWPDGPRALSGRIRRAATFLRKAGIDVSFDRQGRDRKRIIRISRVAAPDVDHANSASASSVASVNAPRFAKRRAGTPRWAGKGGIDLNKAGPQSGLPT